MTTPPNPATTGPDIIEAAVMNVVTKGEGYPVQLCSPERAHQHRSLLCTSRGKRPLAKDWAALSKSTTMPDLGKWLDGGYNVGIVLDGDLVGLDEDVPGGLDVFFRALGEEIPVTMGDIVRTTGKRHLIARLHPDFDPSSLRGTWYSPEGKSLGELVHHRNKQLVAPGCPWSNSDGSLTGWREWNQIDEFAVLSLAACEALAPPKGGFGFSSPSTPTGGVLGEKLEPDWVWEPSLGSRHDLLRDEARRLRGATSDASELAQQTWRFGEQHGLFNTGPGHEREITPEEVAEMAEGAIQKFAPDLKLVVPRLERGEWQVPQPIAPIPKTIPDDLILPVPDYLLGIPTNVTWIGPLCYLGGVSLISGPPKSGKTTVLAGLLHAREGGVPYLSGDPVPVGPSILISEEGGIPLRHKINGLTTLTDIMDRRAFALHGLTTWAQMLGVLRLWLEDHPDSLVIIDTMAVWAGLKDENDAAEITARVVDLTVLAQEYNCAVMLVHHSRKGGGEHGESIRGSSALLGAVDHSVEMDYENALALGRKIEVRSRMHGPTRMSLLFDIVTQTYGLDPTQTAVESADPFADLLKHVPHEGTGDGVSRSDLREVWGVDPRARIQTLMRAGRMTETFVKQGRALAARYHKVDPIRIDLRASVSEEMASIFEKEKE